MNNEKYITRSGFGSVTVPAHAKINLFLEVTSRRSDGYHTIESVMHKAPLHDVVTVLCGPSEDGEDRISLDCGGAPLPTDGRNLAYRAAELFLYECRRRDGSAHRPKKVGITVEKRIPIAAGLAGGSADAAAVLDALSILHGDPFSREELYALGAGLGADVPFCLAESAMHCLGIGEIMTPCAPLPSDIKILIARSSAQKLSTAAAYADIDALPGRQIRSCDMQEALRSGDIDRICGELYNAFELVNPAAEKLKRAMMDLGARGALLSGSGPSVFGLFDGDTDIAAAENALQKMGYFVYI